jgi:ATP-dependent DNA ligase
VEPLWDGFHRQVFEHRGAVAARPAGDALIDGEAVAFLPGGHSDFGALRTKAGRAATGASA